MVKRTYPQNNEIVQAIVELKKAFLDSKVKLWKRLYKEASRPTRSRRRINIVRLDKHTKDNDIVVVPGKLLGIGIMTKKITVAPLQISEKARQKLEKANCKIITITELIKNNPKATNIKIIG